jgi:hypothetical protein
MFFTGGRESPKPVQAIVIGEREQRDTFTGGLTRNLLDGTGSVGEGAVYVHVNSDNV